MKKAIIVMGLALVTRGVVAQTTFEDFRANAQTKTEEAEAKTKAVKKAKSEALIAGDAATKAGTDAKIAAGEPDWAGSFSVGLAMFSIREREVVNATIENGVVRILEERAFRAGPWLQANYAGKTLGGFGGFIGVEVSGEAKLIRSVAMGVLFQFIRPGNQQAINFGLGAHWTSIQRLGAGLVENQAPPAGVTAIRYRSQTQPGVVACVSFGF